MSFREDPPELYDAEAERNSMYCDYCGGYHAGECPSVRCQSRKDTDRSEDFMKGDY